VRLARRPTTRQPALVPCIVGIHGGIVLGVSERTRADESRQYGIHGPCDDEYRERHEHVPFPPRRIPTRRHCRPPAPRRAVSGARQRVQETGRSAPQHSRIADGGDGVESGPASRNVAVRGAPGPIGRPSGEPAKSEMTAQATSTAASPVTSTLVPHDRRRRGLIEVDRRCGSGRDDQSTGAAMTNPTLRCWSSTGPQGRGVRESRRSPEPASSTRASARRLPGSSPSRGLTPRRSERARSTPRRRTSAEVAGGTQDDQRSGGNPQTASQAGIHRGHEREIRRARWVRACDRHRRHRLCPPRRIVLDEQWAGKLQAVCPASMGTAGICASSRSRLALLDRPGRPNCELPTLPA
jgi:hypothetical protein